MLPIAAAFWRVRRRLADDQGLTRTQAERTPMWRLLLDEIRYLARRRSR